MKSAYSTYRQLLFRTAVTSLLFVITIYGISAQTEGAHIDNIQMPPLSRQLLLADSVDRSGRFDSALLLWKNTLEKSLYVNYRYGAAKSLYRISMIQFRKGNYKEVLHSCREALLYCDTQYKSSNIFIAGMYNNIALVYLYMGDYERSMRIFQKALDAYDKYGSELHGENLFNNMAIVLNYLGQYRQALHYLDKAETEAKKNKHYKVYSGSLINKAISYKGLNDSINYRYYLTMALNSAQRYQQPEVEQTATTNLANLALDNNEPDLALMYVQNLARRYPDMIFTNRIHILCTKGIAYFEKGAYTQAKHYLNQTLEIGRQANHTMSVLNAHKYLSRIYEKEGNYRKAHYHLQQEKELRDSTNNKEKTEAVMAIEARYRTAEKDKVIAETKLALKSREQELTKKNFYISLVTSGGILITILLIVLYRNYRIKQRLQQDKLRISVMDSEEKERTRIARELHDSIMIRFAVVKMNLSTFIGTHAYNKDTEELKNILKQLDQATGKLRSAAHNLMPDMLLQEGLVPALDYFCDNCSEMTDMEIELLYYGSIPRLEVNFELSLYRIIQELVQNVIKHAAATQVIIQLSCQEQILTVTVEDDGVGMDSRDVHLNKGIGLKSIENRVKALNGNIEIESSKGSGVSVYLQFQLDNISAMETIERYK